MYVVSISFSVKQFCLIEADDQGFCYWTYGWMYSTVRGKIAKYVQDPGLMYECDKIFKACSSDKLIKVFRLIQLGPCRPTQSIHT